MKLKINGAEYTCTKRIKTADTLVYEGVAPEPAGLSGVAEVYSNGRPILLFKDDLDAYTSVQFSDGTVTAANETEGQPTLEDRVTVLEEEAQQAKLDRAALTLLLTGEEVS